MCRALPGQSSAQTTSRALGSGNKRGWDATCVADGSQACESMPKPLAWRAFVEGRCPNSMLRAHAAAILSGVRLVTEFVVFVGFSVELATWISFIWVGGATMMDAGEVFV